MAHPSGGSGGRFEAVNSLAKAYEFVRQGFEFVSTTGQQIKAIQGTSGDPQTKTIVFLGEKQARERVSCLLGVSNEFSLRDPDGYYVTISALSGV
jgi:hypothetical protein